MGPFLKVFAPGGSYSSALDILLTLCEWVSAGGEMLKLEHLLFEGVFFFSLSEESYKAPLS